MESFSRLLLVMFGFLAPAGHVLAAGAEQGDTATTRANEGLSGFNGVTFNPAIYYLHYSQDVIEDSGDVRLRSNGTLDASATGSNAVLGLEVHAGGGVAYDICDMACTDSKKKVVRTWGWVVGPYIGVFDVTSGLNGFAGGVAGEIWRGDAEGKSKKHLSLGIGRFVHKRRLVLAGDVQIGQELPEGLELVDATRRKDVGGWTIMLSGGASF